MKIVLKRARFFYRLILFDFKLVRQFIWLLPLILTILWYFLLEHFKIYFFQININNKDILQIGFNYLFLIIALMVGFNYILKTENFIPTSKDLHKYLDKTKTYFEFYFNELADIGDFIGIAKNDIEEVAESHQTYRNFIKFSDFYFVAFILIASVFLINASYKISFLKGAFLFLKLVCILFVIEFFYSILLKVGKNLLLTDCKINNIKSQYEKYKKDYKKNSIETLLDRDIKKIRQGYKDN